MSPLVSIIVPIYNTEKYLENCVESLIKQTLKDIEILLVDDASTDNSKEIIEKYALLDTRIIVIYQEKNCGPSATRNTGIKAANGEYVGFVDSDDFVVEDMFEKMYLASQEQQVDIVSCGYNKCDEDNNILSKHPFPIKSRLFLDIDMKIDLMVIAHETKFVWFACRNIYKRSMLLVEGIYFNAKVRFAEDTIFNLYAFYHSNGIFVINEELYYYRDTPDSLTSKKGKSYLEENLIRQYQEKIIFYERFNFDNRALDDLYKYIVSHQLPMILSNAAILEPVKTELKFNEILSLPMIAKSLEYVTFFNRDLPKGIQLTVMLSKLKQLKLLKLLLK
ncbi:glycosyltransferase family 2 protein [Paenisporosarcina sp. TG-14]|uniref:glycosyltransferase family 2 protein n=1 Tax=Paenisporosarcina sp. TG-14 TaxID=1231057 RepID=UPI0002FAF1C8|nr:glycosyltransferase family 2 protein [Paenisporosarcina sp. TG-14]